MIAPLHPTAGSPSSAEPGIDGLFDSLLSDNPAQLEQTAARMREIHRVIETIDPEKARQLLLRVETFRRIAALRQWFSGRIHGAAGTMENLAETSRLRIPDIARKTAEAVGGILSGLYTGVKKGLYRFSNE